MREKLARAVSAGSEREKKELNEEWKDLQKELSRLKSPDRSIGPVGENQSSGGKDRE